MKKRVYGIMHALFVALMMTSCLNIAYDLPHFYRADYFSGEPRLVKPGLGTIEVTFAGGITDEARNCNGDSTSLLDIYGPQNVHSLITNVPCKDPSNAVDAALIYLSRHPDQGCFGYLTFDGKFSLFETIFSWTQNIAGGMFAQITVPIKKMRLTDVHFRDTVYTSVNHPYWPLILNFFPDILSRYNVNMNGFDETGIGDIFLMFGWGINYQETTILDYLDADIKIGVSIPTGRERDLSRIFDIPPGYDGHVAIPVMVQGSLGAYDWLTMGVNFTFIPFFDRTKDIRVFTECKQNGFIKLALTNAKINKGTIFSFTPYLKADHFAGCGLSFVIGYSYTKKQKDTIKLLCGTNINECTVNCDPALQEWNMHTLHLWAEFDASQENWFMGPRLALFYNRQLAGKRVFKTHMAGGTIGLDIRWNF